MNSIENSFNAQPTDPKPFHLAEWHLDTLILMGIVNLHLADMRAD